MAQTRARDVVVGVFHEPEQARRAIEALKDAGFSPGDIGILMQDRGEARDLAEDTGTKAAEGAGIGALGGGILGGLAGWLVGIGALAIPGVGPFIAAGAFATALGGAAIGAGVGAIAGALVGMGIPEDEAKYYEEEVRGGRTLVTVKAGGRYAEARDLLRNNGAYDIENRDVVGAATGGAYGAAETRATATRAAGSASPTPPPAPAGRTTREAGDTVQLREEELRASKQRVEAGEVIVRKDVVEEKRTVEVPVRREEVYVERRPVEGRPVAGGEIRESEQEIRVPVMEEDVRVEKVPVVKEEIRVGKREVEETRAVAATVRKEVADIDQTGAARVGGSGSFRSWAEVMPEYRTRWQSRYGGQGGRWEDYEPGYRYGYEMAYDTRYQGKRWDEVESGLRSDYGAWATRSGYKAEPNAWDRFKEGVREAWDNARGR
jgi:uncharacterized protein (TIGR02271 family)